jgi:hypothetical protein
MPLPLVASGALGVIVAAVSRLVMTRAGLWVVSAMAFLGLQWITYEGLMEPMLDLVQQASNGSGITGELAEWMGVLRVDAYITIVTSAYLVGAAKRAFLARRNS